MRTTFARTCPFAHEREGAVAQLSNASTRKFVFRLVWHLMLGSLLATGSSTAMRAQTGDSTCAFARCGYGIMPTLTALDVVQGSSERHVASLPFLWSKDVSHLFVSDAEAVQHAQRAAKLRTAGAFVSSAGIALVVTGFVTGLGAGGSPRSTALFGLAGVGVLAASVPVHFAADAELSRAVWIYNQRLEERSRTRPISY